MGQFIEPLEGRQLFSTVPAATLNADARATLADLKAMESTGHTNFGAIEAELKSAGEIKSSAVALRALASHAKAAENSLSKNILKTGSLIVGDVKKLVAAASRLGKKPTSASLKKAETTVVTKLQRDASTQLTAINTGIANVASVDKIYAGQIETLNSANANLKSTLTVSGQCSAAARATLAAAATTTLTTDVNAVIAAFIAPTA